ncbi:hypothetical protein Hanom_Chr07g00639651 [Helianthus anomalus]
MFRFSGIPIGAVFLWSYVYNPVRVFSEDSSNNQTEIAQEDLTVSLLPSSESESSIDEGKMKVMLGSVEQRWRSISSHINLKAVFTPSTTGALDTDRSRRDAAVPAVTSIVCGNLLRGLKGSGISLTLVLGIATVGYIFLPVFGTLFGPSACRPSLPLCSSTTVRPSTSHEHCMVAGTITQLFGAGESDQTAYPLVNLLYVAHCLIRSILTDAKMLFQVAKRQ